MNSITFTSWRYLCRITRLIAVTCAATVIIVIVSALTAWSQTRGSEQLVTNPDQVKRILTALDDGVWVADGSAADTHVYVIYSTACGFSKKLFAETRTLPNRPQFRWLTFAAEGHGAEMVVSKRTVESVRDAFAGKYTASTDAATARRAISINQSLQRVLPNQSSLLFPTLIYKTTQGLRISHGAPADLRKLTATVQSRPDRAAYQPASLDWLRKPATMTPPNRLREYVNSSATPVPLHMAPYSHAPIVDEVPNGYVLSVDAVANGEWIRVVASKIETSDVYGYIHAPLQIKLANLEFTVQRASGIVKTGNGSLEIRSHPTMDAPVIERPGPGFEIQRTGEVEFEGRHWVEVLVYDDGTKGYIAK